MALTPKQEKFAQLVADGMSQSDAYREAYNSKAKPDSGGFYIYMLVDPRDGKAFYIGKGKGNRVKHHAMLAHRDHTGNAEKNNKILDIKASGLKVGEVILSYFGDDEAAALSAEMELISLLKHDGITNISGGSGARGSVPAKEASKLLGELAPASWIMQHSPIRAEIEAVFGSIEKYCEEMSYILTVIANKSGSKA